MMGNVGHCSTSTLGFSSSFFCSSLRTLRVYQVSPASESSNLWNFLDQTWAVFDVRPPITHSPLSVCTTHVQARVDDVCLCFLSFSVCYFKVENEEELLLQNLYIFYLFYLSLEPEGGVLGNRLYGLSL